MIINDYFLFRENSKFLKASQYWSEEDMARYQNEKLRILIAHAYENVPYYHRLFKNNNLRPDDIKSISDLPKIPLMTKAAIKLSLDDFRDPRSGKTAIKNSTGGSTGTPLGFYVDKDMMSWNISAAYRAWGWCGFKMGDRIAELWGSSFDIDKLRDSKEKIRAFLLHRMTINAFNMSDDRMMEISVQLRKFNPKVIRAYSSAMHLFADFVRENDIKGINPMAILTTAENLYDHQRKAIEETFQCKVYDGYGSRETSLTAHECEERAGYHLSDENAIVEYIKDGESVSPGEMGEIIITDLRNLTMPFIRYQIEDLGTPTDEPCNCGRTLSMMKSIDGRIHDFIVTSNGNRVPGEFFPHLFKDVEGIQEYRIVQRSIDSLNIEIVKSNGFSQETVDYLLKHMKDYLGDNIEIVIDYPEKIDWPPSGKRRFTVSEVS